MRSNRDRSVAGDARPTRGIVAWLALGLLLTSACGLVAQLTPRERWNRKWGPMVPHATFPGDCEVCHLPEGWDAIRDDFEFDHAAETGVPLAGAHLLAACLRCHNDRGPVAAYTARGCGGCHADPHRGTLGLTCEDCHQELDWYPTGFLADHGNTRFPLTGTHAVVPCEGCHPTASIGDFANAPSQCHLCHQREAIAATPAHVVNGWNYDCERCHTPLSWAAPLFDHSIFPLVGGHGGLDCGQCHPSDLFVGTPNDCYSCHSVDYLTAPDHVANGYSTDCSTCHPITVWQDAI